MSDTPETHEAVERWQQGKINIFDEMARLESERNEWQRKFYEAHRQRDILLNALSRISESLAFAKKHAGKRIE